MANNCLFGQEGCYCNDVWKDVKVQEEKPVQTDKEERAERLRIAAQLFPTFLNQYHYQGQNVLTVAGKKLAALDAVEAADELINAVEETQ